jgi:hypothetical protein
MEDLSGPAIVEGEAGGTVEFREITSGTTISVNPDKSSGRFRTSLPEGSYSVRSGDVNRNIILLPASKQNIDLLKPVASITEADAVTNKSTATVTIVAKVNGKGTHSFRLLADNMSPGEAVKEINTEKENSVTWKVKISDPKAPWVAVIVVDGNMNERRELFGLLTVNK